MAQNQALALREPRDFWDPTYVSEDGSINQQYATATQPLKTIAFRIPRLRALVNAAFKDVYTTPLFPNVHTDPVPLSLTEWNVAAAGETDFSTALADADVFGILGRERMFSASRWTAADSTTPAYQALKLYRNYDGAHHTFAPISVSATNDGDPSLFSSYAAIDAAGTTLTVLVDQQEPECHGDDDPQSGTLCGVVGENVHALTSVANDDRCRNLRPVEYDVFLCALLGDVAGNHRLHRAAACGGVGPQS